MRIILTLLLIIVPIEALAYSSGSSIFVRKQRRKKSSVLEKKFIYQNAAPSLNQTNKQSQELNILSQPSSINIPPSPPPQKQQIKKIASKKTQKQQSPNKEKNDAHNEDNWGDFAVNSSKDVKARIKY